jgi:hypothetical protein
MSAYRISIHAYPPEPLWCGPALSLCGFTLCLCVVAIGTNCSEIAQVIRAATRLWHDVIDLGRWSYPSFALA